MTISILGRFAPCLLATLAAALVLSACGREHAASPVQNTAAGSAALPADPALAALYESSCKNCHANPASGAPLSGDAKAWAPRIAQGADTLLDHSINGYQGMPPMGMCMQCSEEEFVALISFMSGAHLEQP